MHEVDMAALDDLLGNTKALQKLDKRQRLELELRAIEFWDANYYADHPGRDEYAICAFKARQSRKEEILRELGLTKISKSRPR